MTTKHLLPFSFQYVFRVLVVGFFEQQGLPFIKKVGKTKLAI